MPEDNNNPNFFYSKDGKEWHPIGEIHEIKIDVSEEDAARLFDLMCPLFTEPLEIIPNVR